jgi:hypothetical protein
MPGISEMDTRHLSANQSPLWCRILLDNPLASVRGFLYTCEHRCAIIGEVIRKCQFEPHLKQEILIYGDDRHGNSQGKQESKIF